MSSYDEKELEERVKKNLAEFERLERMNEEYEREKREILEKAKELKIDLDMKIPWDLLSPEQRRELERIKEDAERDLKSIETRPGKIKSPRPRRGIMV